MESDLILARAQGPPPPPPPPPPPNEYVCMLYTVIGKKIPKAITHLQKSVEKIIIIY